ncbi:MAG: hypothetical protein ACLQNU_00915 [Candidatus Dormibacteria bacterium]
MVIIVFVNSCHRDRIGLAIFGHRKILAVALALLVVALGLLVWRIWHRGGFAFQHHPDPEPTTLDRPGV